VTFPSSSDSRAAPLSATTGSPRVAALLWIGLVALAVCGRLWQPHWNGQPLWHATPLAAVALAAGAVFGRSLLAASVPLAGLFLSNLALPGYESVGMAAVVYLATAWPVLLGGFVRDGRLPAVVTGALASSLVFFLATNLAHWLLTVDYPRTLAGLATCFAAALPFYRWMPVGDVVWSVVVFAGLTALARLTGLTQLSGLCGLPGPARLTAAGTIQE
jgi:hypothetical protein